jgi:hypothetical protein
MAAVVTITSSALTGSPVRVYCNSVSIGLSKANSIKPIENGTALAEVSTTGLNNPTYTLNGVSITGQSGTLTYTNVLELMALKYTGANAPTISIVYGKAGTTTTLPHLNSSLSVATEAIPVVLQSANITFDAKETQGAYLPGGTLTFVETR